MSQLISATIDLGYIEILAKQDSPVHRLNPRAKLIVSFVYIIILMSFPSYEISSLLPFFLYPLIIILIGNVPILYLVRRIIIVSPFALMIGIFNPLFDRQLIHIGNSFTVSAGWISFLSIMIRFVLTVGTAIALLAVTGFYPLCRALERLKVPQVFAVQLLLLYRYIHVLIEEALRMFRAHSLRSVGRKKVRLNIFGSMIGNLLLRSLERGERIYMAMKCRGFDGLIRTSEKYPWRVSDTLFVGFCSLYVLICRFVNVSELLGNLFLKVSI